VSPILKAVTFLVLVEDENILPREWVSILFKEENLYNIVGKNNHRGSKFITFLKQFSVTV